MEISPQTAYDNLKFVDHVDAVESAEYREQAQEMLADPEVSLDWQEAIADRLIAANHDLTTGAINDENSY